MTATGTNPNSGEWGGYQLVAELGHGGMADVFLVVMRGLGNFSKLQVLKRLRASLADDPEFVAMLIEEARLAARLNHPNIVQTNSAGEHNGQPWLTMEYLDGQPLHRILRRARGENNALAQPTLYAVIADVLSGLHHAHELTDFDKTPLDVVHRDVSPQNVFVTYDGQVKVVDFGIAKAARRSTEATAAGVIKGKLAYMSPEQARAGEVDRRTDIFAVGVMLWEIATGKRIWQGLDELGILHRLLSGEIPMSPRAAAPEVSLEIDAICRRALAVRAEDRYATAAEMQADLEAYLRKEGGRLPLTRLGEQVATLFSRERADARALIEMRLSAIANGASTASAASADTPASADEVATDVLSGVSTGRREMKSSRRARATVISVAIATAAAAIVGVSVKPRPTPKPVEPPIAAAPPPEQLSVSLIASPPDASFTIDEGHALTNPTIVTYPRDGRRHRVVISAPGYEPLTRDMVFDGNERHEFALKRVPQAATPVTPVVTAEPIAKPNPFVSIQPANSGLRRGKPPPPLEENVYGKPKH